MVLGAAGREHVEVARGKARFRALVNRVKRVHQAVAERVGVDVERRVDEMRDVGPEGLVSGLELDRGTEALALHFAPDLAEPLGGQLALFALDVDLALEFIERDLPHHGVDHVLDLGGEHGAALLLVLDARKQRPEREHLAEYARRLRERQRGRRHQRAVRRGQHLVHAVPELARQRSVISLSLASVLVISVNSRRFARKVSASASAAAWRLASRSSCSRLRVGSIASSSPSTLKRSEASVSSNSRCQARLVTDFSWNSCSTRSSS